MEGARIHGIDLCYNITQVKKFILGVGYLDWKTST